MYRILCYFCVLLGKDRISGAHARNVDDLFREREREREREKKNDFFSFSRERERERGAIVCVVVTKAGSKREEE